MRLTGPEPRHRTIPRNACHGWWTIDASGDHRAQREEMLQAQRQVVEDRIALLHDMLGFIDSKMEFYAGVLSGRIEYHSNLLVPDADSHGELRSRSKKEDA